MVSNTLGSDVMMQLGSFQFGVSTAAYQDLTRSTEHTWASQDRFGQLAALQYTGPGADSITLPGVIYTEYRGGTGQLNDLRDLAAEALPQLMMDGSGNVLGLWVIERVEEKQMIFGGGGAPRKQDFTLSLRKFEDLAAQLVEAIQGAASTGAAAAAVGDVATAAGAVKSVTSLAGKLKGLASGAMASLKGSLASVTGIAGQLQNQAKSAMGAITRGIDAAKGLRDLATSTISTLKNLPTMAAAAFGAGNLASYAVGMLTQSTSAELVMKGVIGNLSGGLTSQANNILVTAKNQLGTLSGTARFAGSAATSLKGLLG